jgi:hypothetical protein
MNSAQILDLIALASGSVLLLVSTGYANNRAMNRARWRTILSVSGAVLMLLGLGARYVASPDTSQGICSSEHCYHGARWPPKVASR